MDLKPFLVASGLFGAGLALIWRAVDRVDSRVSRLEFRTAPERIGPDPGSLEEMRRRSIRELAETLRDEGLVIVDNAPKGRPIKDSPQA